MLCENKLTNLVLKNQENSTKPQFASFFFLFFFLIKKKLRMKCMNVMQCRSQKHNKQTNKQTKKKKKKKKEVAKGFKLCFALFSWFLRTRLGNLFSHNMSFVPCLTLMSLLIVLYQLKLCSACCVGKIFMVFDYYVLIMKSHVFYCWT